MVDLYLNSFYELFVRQAPLRKAVSTFLLNVRDFLLWPAKKQQLLMQAYQIKTQHQYLEELLQPVAVRQSQKMNVIR